MLLLAVIVSIATTQSCKRSIAVLNQQAYENATTLKAEALALMDLATEKQFAEHEDEVRRLMTEISAAYEYANGIPKNSLSAQQWESLRGSNLLGGFFSLWKSEGKLLSGDVEANRKNVEDAFDEIITLEKGKIGG